MIETMKLANTAKRMALLTLALMAAMAMPWWQTLGAMVISGLPLWVLAFGLYQLYLLFTCYGRGDYFTVASAVHLGKVSKAVALWVVLSFLCEPLLSLWLTMTSPPGQRMVSLSLQPLWPYSLRPAL